MTLFRVQFDDGAADCEADFVINDTEEKVKALVAAFNKTWHQTDKWSRKVSHSANYYPFIPGNVDDCIKELAEGAPYISVRIKI